MSKSNTSAPKCVVCGNNHWLRDPHIWKDVPPEDSIVATLKKKVRTMSKKVRTMEDIEPSTTANVRTIRRVSLKEMNRSASKNFNDLPFIVTKNGKDIARVEKV